ncbi:fungal-specific transcription factor domain-containing protein [Melanogaster broomeanus]|nr:fungal-specific transcription factor domain-containing protein [Melanogaster broomeanus]
MSSAEDDYNDGENNSTSLPENKKRRVQRACDICRRKKSDGSQMPGNRCTSCIAYNFECTYVEAAKKRGPPKGFVCSPTCTILRVPDSSLENRLEKMEKLLQRVCPDADFTRELGGGRMDREMWQRANPGFSTSVHVMNAPSASTSAALSSGEDLVPSDDEDIVTTCLSESLSNMKLNPSHTRFFGKSSGVMLIQRAIDLKKEFTGDEDARREDLFNQTPNAQDPLPWERPRNIKEADYIFPEDDLGASLIDLYFVHMNSITPLLHRPSFERKVMHAVHLRDPAFGAVYLLVCAVGSRFSDDPRVFLEETNYADHSVGWKYFEQVQMVRKTLLGTPCLEDLQVYCLSALFLQGASAPQACWTIVGVGIRLAQDVGAHRRKAYSSKLSVEGELWKRAFWVLVTMDRHTSSSLGRPCAIQDEDFDLDLPVECDDEYWEHPDPDQTFKQPPEKPSTVSFFICFLKLNHILAFALRTIYSINKSKVLLGFVGQQWEQHIVAELDSALNKWVDAVPNHCKDVNTPFFMQSSVLYASYYLVQILIHRPFIPSPRKPSPLSFPSLAICTNAARSCSHVIDIYRRRSRQSGPFMQMPAFTAGIVLLLNIWGGKRSGLSTDPSKEMADVHKCMAVLQTIEKRWHTAGRLWDILYELASVGDLPLPQPSPTGATKRDRDDGSSPASSVHSASTPPEGPRAIAGSRRVPRDGQSRQQPPTQRFQQQQQQQHAPQAFNLPVHSNDLGRLPVHGQVNFMMNAAAPATASTPPQTDSSGMWYPSLPTATAHLPPNAPLPASAPSHAHHFTQPGVPSTYSMDDLFYDHMTSSYGGAFASQHESPGAQFPGANGAAGATGGQPESGGHASPSEHDLQALMNAASANVQPPLMTTQRGGHAHGRQGQGQGQGGVDSDTMAMWSSAPTGFELNDWGTYLTNVSGMVHPDGATPHSRPGRGHGTGTDSEASLTELPR